MIHPHTRLHYVNEEIGLGVFATQLIPAGTVVYARDPYELEFTGDQYEALVDEMKEIVNKYSYMDEHGVRIVSWDFGKYVNHCCDSSTLSTGFGFDIAVRDIREGEELTCEYGALNVDEDMPLLCSRPGCRQMLKTSDFDALYAQWDERLKPVLRKVREVPQPLWWLLDEQSIDGLDSYLRSPTEYRSIYSLKYSPAVGAPAGPSSY